MGKTGIVSVGTPQTAALYMQELEQLLAETPVLEALPREHVAQKQASQLLEDITDALGRLTEKGCTNTALVGVGAERFIADLRAHPAAPISIAGTLRDHITHAGYRAVFLLGSYAAMKEPYLKRPIILSHVAVITPSEEEKRWLSAACVRARNAELSEEDRAHIAQILAQGAEEGAQALVSADPVITRLADELASPYPTIDALSCHIKGIAHSAEAARFDGLVPRQL